MSADAPPAAPSKGRGLLVPLAALVLGAGAVVGVLQVPALRALAGVAPPAVAVAEVEPPVEYGEFAELDGIVVNPKGTGGRRYLMVKIGVEAEDAATLARLDLLRPAAVDAVIDLMSAETVERLADIGQRDSLKTQVRERFNAMLGEDGPVSRIYFTQFVLQ